MHEEPTDIELAPFEVRARTSSYMTELVFWTGALAGSLFLVLSGWVGGDAPIVLRSLLSTFLGSIGAVCSVAGGLNLVHLLRDHRPALQVSEEGILNRTYWHSATLVPWEEVVDIRRTRHPWILEVVLRDPEAYRDRQTRTVRIWMRLTSLLGVGPFPVFLPQLKAPRAEVLHQLVDAVDAIEIAAIRGQRLLEEGSVEPRRPPEADAI